MSDEPSRCEKYYSLRENHPDLLLPDVWARVSTDSSLDTVHGGSIDTAMFSSAVQEEVSPELQLEKSGEGAILRFIMDEVPQKPYEQRGGPYHQCPAARLVVAGGNGISLDAALQGDTSGLEGEGDLPFKDISCVKPSLRINWPGYPAYSRQISFNGTSHKHPTTLGKLAKLVAKEMMRFIEINANVTGSDPEWRLNSETVSMQMLYLTEVRHVAVSSFQPEFVLLRLPA